MESIVPSQEDFSAVCLHNLIAVETSVISHNDTTSSKLESLIIRNTEKFLSRLFELPTELSDEGRLLVIPQRQAFPLPRQRKIPSVKPKSRWEKFAQDQNIQKRKRSRLVWDDTSKDWKPRWGMGSAKRLQQKADEAIIELKNGEDFKTVIESRRASGKLAKKKQDFREVRNKVEAAGGKIPRVDPNAGIGALGVGDRKKGKAALIEMNRRAAVSTASFGIHDKKVELRSKKTAVKSIQKVKAKKRSKK